MPVDVAVIIVAYNSAHVIVDLLESLPLALGPLTADVLVVDNDSTDGTAELLSGRSDCRVIRSPNVGYAGGVNVGVDHAEPASAILVLNPDTRLAPGAVVAMWSALDQPGTGVVAPQVRNRDGTLYPSLRREPTLRRALGLNFTHRPALSEYIGRPEEYVEAKTVDWALGAVLLMSNSCYAAVGGWDASYFLYSEETDFCLRARDLGYETRYEPTAVVMHIGGESGQNIRTHVMQIVNRVRLYARRHGTVAGYAYLIVTILSEASWIPRGGRRQSWEAIRSLVQPSRRPVELGCSSRLLPR